MSAKELVNEYIEVIYDTYQAHVVENNDYETFGHAMVIVMPMVMKIMKDLSEAKEIKPEGAKTGDERLIKTTDNE